MNSHSILREIKDFFNELDIPVQNYAEQPDGREFLKLTDRNIVLNINLIFENSGIDNLALKERFSESGLQLIQVWEDLWQTRKEVVKSRLRALAGKSSRIYGRETEALRITNPVLVNFLEKNHLYLPLKGKYKYGLFHKDRLVSVASFSYPRNISVEGKPLRSFELLRFCHLNDHIVTGGLTKLLNIFTKEINPGHLMTYIDREWSDGEGFKKAGFEITGELPPKTFLIHPGTFKRLYTPNVKNNLVEPAEEKNFIEIYNCGSLKLEKVF